MNWFRGAIGVSPSAPNRAYVSVSSFPGIIMGVWRTDDTGSTWNQVLVMGTACAYNMSMKRYFSSWKTKQTFVIQCSF